MEFRIIHKYLKSLRTYVDSILFQLNIHDIGRTMTMNGSAVPVHVLGAVLLLTPLLYQVSDHSIYFRLSSNSLCRLVDIQFILHTSETHPRTFLGQDYWLLARNA